MKAIQFTEHCSPFLAGQIASFPDAEAKKFVDAKLAVPYVIATRRTPLKERLVRKKD